ncbi:MAG: sigma 54-interacting transcriptional regulator [Planctomycetota bacterium]
MANLVFLNGTDPGYSISVETSARIGRGIECNVRLDDEQASRIHAKLELVEGKWLLEDCESLNGTLVNSSPMERRTLVSGDLIRIGESILLFCEDTDPNAEKQIVALGDQTRVRRILGREKRRIADDPIGSDSTSGPVRKLSCLYRLSKQIYQAKNLDSLMEYAVSSIRQVLGAREARLSLRLPTGRLKVFSTCSEPVDCRDNWNLLAGWVIEKDEALLLDLNDNVSWQSTEDSVEKGTCLAVPICGSEQPIGAIECFQPEEERPFNVPDLEFLISVGQHLALAIEHLRKRERIHAANENLRKRLGQTRKKLIGECPGMVKLRNQISRVAQTDITVLVLGESGTGKEVVSQTIHELSRREEGPFLAVNCAAFNDSLLESELFGHEKGAFTGASKKRPGKFEAANGGTVFLDEVGELSAGCQAKLLRLLEGQSFHRVGGNQPIEVDVRIVAATHRDLEKMVQQGSFRKDLWYRLRVVELLVPPLRDREEDVLDLAEQFLMEFQEKRGFTGLKLSESAKEAIQTHNWPGNVRELRNSLERAVVLANNPEIDAADLGIIEDDDSWSDHPTDLITLKELERAHLKNVLEATGGNKTKACEILGITRAALYNKLSRMELKQA